jgi:hypothetical protein
VRHRGVARNVAAGLLALLALAGCSGSSHGHHHQQHHRHHHGKKAKSGGGEPSGFLANPPLAPVSAGVPGLRAVAISVPAATVQLTPPSDQTSKPAERAFSKKIADAAPNAVIHLASGDYPRLSDTAQRHTWVTVSGEGDATKPVIDGAKLLGAEHVRFVDVQFSAGVKISHNPPDHARWIQILNSEIDCGASSTGHGKVGIGVRGASQDVEISGDYIHNCVVGFTSGAADNDSQNISITHCLIEQIYGDAIDLGGIDGMEITNNVIRDIHRSPRPGHPDYYHDDGIQFFGNAANVVIAYNVDANSTDQLIFIQDAVKSKFTGVRENRDILVLGNLVYGAGALAVQDEGGVDVQFIGNTIWANHDGSLRVRRSPYSHTIPTHTLIADNIIGGFSLVRTPHVVQGYNIFSHAKTTAKADIVTADPGFASPDSGNFGLASRSRASGSAAPSPALVSMAREAGANAALLKIIAAYRASDRGSLIAASSGEGFGAPFHFAKKSRR